MVGLLMVVPSTFKTKSRSVVGVGENAPEEHL
jgi:hypothetical protein